MNTPLDSSVRRALTLKSHKPSRKVNKTMSALVSSVTQAQVGGFEHLDTTHVSRLRQVASSTEYELERYWSKKIANAKNSRRQLQKFPYTANYAELVKREVALLETTQYATTAQSDILIVGSGPLPLTYLELAKQTDANITLVDSSIEAITLSRSFCAALGLEAEHLNDTAETIVLAKQFDVILLAALVGETDVEKQGAIANLTQYLNPDGRVIIRSAQNARTLLYPQVSKQFSGLQLVAEEHPTDEVINSILIYKKESHEK